MAGESKAVERILLFKLKEGIPQEEMEVWVSALNALNSLECVEPLCGGPANTSAMYTHAMYARYSNREALAQYNAHPLHVAHMQDFSLVEDLLGLDCEAAELFGKDRPRFESFEALRIAFLKPRQDLDKTEIVEILSGYAETFPSIVQISVGENFAAAKAKGFGWSFLCVFGAVKDLQELNNNEQNMVYHNEKGKLCSVQQSLGASEQFQNWTYPPKN